MTSQNNNTPRFSIIIPTATNYTGFVKCIESVIKFTDLSQCEIICVANGAPSELKYYTPRQIPNFYLLWFDEMIGFTRAVNEGLAIAKGEYVVLLNDDVILLDQPKNLWVDELHKPFADPKMGITGPLKNYCPAAQRDFLLFFCVMIRKSMLDEIGVLDMCFNPGGGEDTDLTCRAVDRGWKIQAVPDEPPTHATYDDPSLPAHQQGTWLTRFPLYHAAGCTVGSPAMFDEYQKVIARNSEILRKRYAVNIERAKTIEGWMLESELAWLGQQARTAIRFLEVGSWHGRSSRAIADNLPENGVLICCDSWNGSSGEPDAHATAQLREGDDAFLAFWHNNHDHILSGKIIPIRMQGANAAAMLRHLGIKVEVAFVDADHSYEGCKADILNFRELVKEGGLICGHDYSADQPSWVGVQQAVDELYPHAQQAPNTSIWHVKNETPPTPWEMIKYLPVSESHEGYGGFFSA